jgi:Polysulfide reductase
MVSDARMPDGEPIVTKAPPWHLAVTLDIFLSSISSGTFIIAAMLFIISPIRWAVPSILGFFVAFAVEVADLIALVADLGDPYRFHHMLRMMKFRSPMSLGVWLSSGLAFFAFLASAISFLITRGNLNLIGALQIVAAIGALFALGVAMYKGVLFSATAQPVWNSIRWLGADLSISAGACGITMMLAIATVIGDFTGALTLRFAAGCILTIDAVAIALVMRHINRALAPKIGRVELISWNVVTILIGAAIPAVLAFLPRYFAAIDLIILTLTLAGAFTFKHILVMLPHWLSAE